MNLNVLLCRTTHLPNLGKIACNPKLHLASPDMSALCPIPSLQTVVSPLSRLVQRTSIRLASNTISFVRPFSYDHVVIGAGVVGLAVAANLAKCFSS
jgi:hypothetical protein